MKILYLFTALICFNLSAAQIIKTLNKGRVVQKSYNVTVPYKDINGLVIVKAVIKGRIYNFMVDTGAMTAVSQRIHDELGLKSGTLINVSDSSDLEQNLQLVTLPPLQVGAITFKDTPAVVFDSDFFLNCLGIDGCIGSNMMRNSVVKFSYKDKTVSFSDKLKNFSSDKNKSADLMEDQRQSIPYLRIVLKNNDIEGGEGIMFDSGMVGLYDLSLTTYDTLKKFILFSPKHQAKGSYSIGIHGVANQADHHMLLLPELNFAGTAFKNVTTTTTNDDTSRIGSQILRYGDVIVDYPRRKLYFNPFTDGPIDVSEKNWPVQPVFLDNKLFVGIVWDPAFDDRVNVGDQIMKFGDVDYTNIDPCEAFRQNAGPKGDIIVLVLKDKDTGEIKNVAMSKI